MSDMPDFHSNKEPFEVVFSPWREDLAKRIIKRLHELKKNNIAKRLGAIIDHELPVDRFEDVAKELRFPTAR